MIDHASSPGHPHFGAYSHFRKRVQERIGHDYPAGKLWEMLVAEITAWEKTGGESGLVEYIGRLNKNGYRMFEFRTNTGQLYVVIYDTDSHVPITVYPPDLNVKCGKGQYYKAQT